MENEFNSNIVRKLYPISINGINIKFPYKPYENQINYMKKVIELLNDKLIINDHTKIGALESPTGTGKTLSLLCSILGWFYEMKKLNKFHGKIIYTSRTHSQISQVINELKKTCYKPKIAVLSSREFSCVNEHLKKRYIDINQLNIICRNIRKNRCIFKNQFDDDIIDYLSLDEMPDIEDLCNKGKQNHFCPFYYQINKAQKEAEMIFLPYNYLFNENIRNNIKLDLKNSIIIIDEAHNIRKVCEEEKSFEISEKTFEEMINELFTVLKNKEKKINEIEKIYQFQFYLSK